jgi:hypothetical protein
MEDYLIAQTVTQPLVAFEGGATRSRVPRYDLIHPAVLRCLAERLELGIRIHGENNWKLSLNDPVYIREVKNHMMGHIMDMNSGNIQDTEDGNIGAILFGCMVLLEAKKEANRG